MVASLQGGSDYSKGQTSPLIPLAQSVMLGVLAEQETGMLCAAHSQLLRPGVRCSFKTQVETITAEQEWSSSVGLLESFTR